MRADSEPVANNAGRKQYKGDEIGDAAVIAGHGSDSEQD